MLKILIVATAISYITGASSLDLKYKHLTSHLTNNGNLLKNATFFSFNCTNRPIGFYADVEYDCQIFHMCDQEGHRIPHSCANDTSFNQEYRICDWKSNFECKDAPKWYFLNSLTYATDPPPADEEEYN